MTLISITSETQMSPDKYTYNTHIASISSLNTAKSRGSRIRGALIHLLALTFYGKVSLDKSFNPLTYVYSFVTWRGDGKTFLRRLL